MANKWDFIKSQLFITPTYPTTSCKSKIIIVTGANAGLGREAARHFVRLGAAKVIIAVRTISKGEDAKAWIEEQEKCGDDVISVWSLDLSSYDSVKAFAKKAETLPRLDAVVENAGIVAQKFTLAEGHESTITVNVISTFLLAFLLLPKLRETAQMFNTRPRLTIVTSETHFWTDFPERNSPKIFPCLDEKETTKMGMSRYMVSKLLEVFTVRELIENVIGEDKKDTYPVVINMVNPGLCYSQGNDDAGFVFKIILFILARTTEVGARTLVNAAVEIGDESQGEYLCDGRIAPISPFARSDEGKKTQAKVWQELVSILEEIEPGVTSRV